MVTNKNFNFSSDFSSVGLWAAMKSALKKSLSSESFKLFVKKMLQVFYVR